MFEERARLRNNKLKRALMQSFMDNLHLVVDKGEHLTKEIILSDDYQKCFIFALVGLKASIY